MGVTLLVAVHVIAAVIWVGGMFFAYMVLRPSAGPLEAPIRLSLWQRVLSRFFLWVWASIVVLLVSGYAMLFSRFGGFQTVPLYVNVMQLTGIAMMLLFLHLYFAPWRRFSRAVEAQVFQDAAAALDQIRRIVKINLVLGFITVIAGASGRFWG
jgi:uncharacterized membrane protein